LRSRSQTRDSRKTHRDLPDANKWFHCVRCCQPISPVAPGTQHRNHCPYCLWSRHVDEEPGDRASECHGAMEPVSVWVRPGGDWAVIHRCRKCGTLHSNRIAGDDNELALVSLSVRAFAQPPFPLERLFPTPEPTEEQWPSALNIAQPA
jgi:hypothetical protein